MRQSPILGRPGRRATAATPPPLWFQLVAAALIAIALRYADRVLGGAGGDPPPVQLAFWALFATIIGFIWKGLEVAGRLTLTALAYSVHALWWFARTIATFAKDFGLTAVKGFRRTWEFLRHDLDNVLLGAWRKFWRFIDWAKVHLESLFKPVFAVLKRLRTELLGFYTRFVRPVLDLIGIGRKVLRILQTFGIDWAKALDRKLADLEARIDAPFRFLLAELNKVINVVNRIVTVDGLFQRLALIRSLERDWKYVQNQWANAFHRKATDEEEEAAKKKPEEIAFAKHLAEARAVAGSRDNPYASRIEEEIIDVRRMLARR